MDQRRAAGALLALVVCIASTAAAPTASNQTALDLYDGSIEGCYYNFQHYGEGDRIMTNEPCLNCTCHNRMLMCYLRVCPFTKPIGQDCTVEKRADQCCPIVTCPDVPVDLLTSTSTTSPAEYGATGLGKLDKYGCSINGKYFPEGSKVPPTPNKPCEHCYCIRNMTTCVMQECTLHVDGCTPIYHKDVCCPVRYSCDHPEDSTLLLDDMTTTVRPTPGFLLTTTTLSPVTQMSQDCVHDDQIFPDGALIKTEKACEHCYCMKGDIVCVVQECGTPMENEGKNCTSEPPREGQCCPDTYICEGDEVTTEPTSEFSTQSLLEELTTISPPRRVGVEGSGYRNEPDEPVYTEGPSMETEPEGSGYEHSTEPAAVDDSNLLTSEMPETSSKPIDESPYPSRTTIRTPTLEEVEKTTEPDKGLNTVPSDASDEEIYKPSITEKTPLEEPKVTETTLTSDEKLDDSEEKTTSADDVFMPIVTTKLEESLSTTESAFRKEDTLGGPTEIYDLGEPDKVSTQATDIEKEIEEDVTSSKTKAPFMEELEKQTTLSPQYTQKDIEQEIPSKESTTESVLDVTTAADIKPNYNLTDDSIDLDGKTTKPTVEKVDMLETTSSDQNEIDDILTTLPPGRIPGEGDCLLNDVTYRNNSNVPSSNNCHTSCRCVSSIIKCDPIICSPPPEYMDNCQPTYDSPDSCCPTYVCHTGETIPPQPHSQMSGTDSPLPSSPIDCHGDECEVKKDDNVPLAGDCGPAGCGDEHSGAPETPSEDCHDGKCLLPVQPCVDGNCQETPAAHCENGKCGTEPEIVPVKDVPVCENESECKGTISEVSEPNSQMTGTDSPLPSSPIECHDGGCEVRKDDNVPVVGDCGPTGCSDGHAGIPETSPEDCHDGKCILPIQPCTDGNCQETPVAHCENGKCGIEPEIVPVKDKPLCENESDCKATVPEVHSCEGEDCAIKQPLIPGQDEGSCEGDCKTPEDEKVEPCTDTSCRRKETGEVDSSLPSDCLGSECTQQPTKEDNLNELSTALPITEDVSIKSTQLDMTTSRYEMQTESPELQTKSSEDTSEQQTTQIGDLALKEDSTGAPLLPATEGPSEDKFSGTEPSSQFDHPTESQLDKEDTVTKLPEETGETITKEPPKTATKTQSPVTESPDITTKLESEESLQTGTTQHTVYGASTESPEYDTEVYDIRTEVPQEAFTKSPESPEYHEELSTEAPEQDYTESSVPHKPDQADVDKVTKEPVPYTPEFDIASSKLPEQDIKQEVTESHATEVTEISSHDVTESNEIVDEITKAPESVDKDVQKLTTEMFQQELTTEGAKPVTKSQEPEVDASYATSTEKEIELAPFTKAPTESYLGDVTDSITTKIIEASTAKASEDISGVTSETPEIYKTEKQEPFTEFPGEYITGSQELSTKQPDLSDEELLQTESPEFTTDETIGEPEINISEEDTKSQTSATPETDIKVTTLSSITGIMEEGTTQASVSEEKTTISESAEKPVVDDEKEPPVKSPDTNEVYQGTEQETDEKPATPSTLQEDQHTEEPDSKVTISDKTETESIDTLITEQPSKIPIDDYNTEAPEQLTESGQEITEQQDVSTEEPSISLVTDKIPSEPYIPVHPEIIPDLASEQPDIINEIPGVEQDTQTPASKDDVEIETKIPDRLGLNEVTEIPEHIDTESPEVKIPDTATEVAATQPPEVYSETPEIEDVHKDEQSVLTEKPTTDAQEKLETKAPEALTTEIPTVDEVPEKTRTPEIIVPEQQETETVTTEKMPEPSEDEQEQTLEPEKYSTVSVIQETTAPSVAQQESSEQPTEPEVTESDTSYATSAPESHVKEPQGPVTETAETFTTESQDMGVSVPHEKLSPDETVTEGSQQVSSGAPKEKPIEVIPDEHQEEKPKEKPEIPQDAYTRTPGETSTVLLEVATEPSQEVIPVKPQESEDEPQEKEKSPKDKVTEKPDQEEPVMSTDDSLLETSTGLDTAVTEPTQHKVTEPHVDEVTSTIPLDEKEKITTDGLLDKMTTVIQEQPQESSTRIPQDITSSLSDSELPEKYTVAVPQDTTLLPERVTDAPEKQETSSPQEASTGKPLEEEDVEMRLTTLKTPQTEDSTGEQVTEGHEQVTGEPTIYGTQEPYIVEKESTDAPVLPTEESADDEYATPDVVELEEHSHIPVEEISTIGPTEEEIIPSLPEYDEEKQKPQITTEKQTNVTETDTEKVSIPFDEYSPEISMVTTMDIGEIPHKSTLPPSIEESEQHTDVPITSQPGTQVGDQRFGDDTTQEEHQVTQSIPEIEQSPISDTEIPVQTEKVPTEKVTESELSHETTMLEEVSHVTSKGTTVKEEEESSTQKPEYGESEETLPKEKPEEKPQEEPVEKPLEEPTETPQEEPIEKPTEEQEQKPLDEIEPVGKPEEEKPLEEKPTQTPLEETTIAPLVTEESLVRDEDKLGKPLDQAEEKPAETPEPKPQKEVEEKPTEATERIPFEEEVPTEKPQEKPLRESDKMPEETPEEKPLDEAHEKPAQQSTETPSEGTDEKLAEKPKDKPLDEMEEQSTEKPVETPIAEPEEKPQEVPEKTPSQLPEEKPQVSIDQDEPQEVSEETPLKSPEKKPEETPEDVSAEKPEITEDIPQEVPQEKPKIPEEKPQDIPEAKPDVPEEEPIEVPKEKPELPEEKPQEIPEEKPQELPVEKPEAPEEKPQEVPEETPQEVPEETPQEVPGEKPEVSEEKPQGVLEEKPQEMPEEKPETPEKKPETPEEKPETPEEKPQEVAEEKPEVPEDKSQDVPDVKPEVSEEKPQDVPEEKPEAPEEKPEAPEEEPETPKEKPQEVPEEKPEVPETPEEKPQEVPEEKPEVPEEKPQDVPEEKPQDVPEEKPQEVPAEIPVVFEEKPQDVPEEKPQEVPAEIPVVFEEKPQDVPEETPQEVPAEKPEAPEEKPQEEPKEKPELPEEIPQEMPEEKPQELPVETPEAPEEKPDEVPGEITQEVPGEKPEVPEEKPQVPEEKPQEMPEEKPELPAEKPEMPEEKPQEVPEVKPEVPETPEEKPQEVPKEKPEVPEEKPQDVLGEKPQDVLEEKPQDLPEEKPQEVPAEIPVVPEEKPQDVPEETPQEKPEKVPEQKPQEVPEEKPAEPASTASPETSKPGFSDVQPTDEVPDDDNQFPPSGGTSGYGTEPDYVEEDQAFGPGTCRYGGKVYVSAQQIPRDDPCDFCFCFRSDIICLQQSCPPPIHGCHEEPIQGFCCPRYECPVAMATTLNVTTTTTTTTTTLPPHFLPHAYKGAAQRRGCQIKGHTYKVGEVVRASSGPCLHCTCGGDGQMKCDPKACTPEPMLRQMIAAAVSAKRRR